MRMELGKSLLNQHRCTARWFCRSFSHFLSGAAERSFGIAFDIDGVLLLGEKTVGGSPRALQRLFHPSGQLAIPFILLTNGGGVRESERAVELSHRLDVKLLPLQIVQGHAPFKQLLSRFKDDLIIAVGKGKPADVMRGYGYRNVLSIDEYTSYFDEIDPLAKYKSWTTGETVHTSSLNEGKDKIEAIHSQSVKAAFVVSDSVDWSRDIQVLCDILSSGGLPGRGFGSQPDLYFANDDLSYQATFPVERLGMGAFRIALESVYNSINPKPLEYTSFGKPNPRVFSNAEAVLFKLASSRIDNGNSTSNRFKTLYMVGDNPYVDIKGAKQAGHPWYSILTRTGVFKGKGNHPEFPADMVVDTVEDAVEHILERESAKNC